MATPYREWYDPSTSSSSSLASLGSNVDWDLLPYYPSSESSDSEDFIYDFPNRGSRVTSNIADNWLGQLPTTPAVQPGTDNNFPNLQEWLAQLPETFQPSGSPAPPVPLQQPAPQQPRAEDNFPNYQEWLAQQPGQRFVGQPVRQGAEAPQRLNMWEGIEVDPYAVGFARDDEEEPDQDRGFDAWRQRFFDDWRNYPKEGKFGKEDWYKLKHMTRESAEDRAEDGLRNAELNDWADDREVVQQEEMIQRQARHMNVPDYIARERYLTGDPLMPPDRYMVNYPEMESRELNERYRAEQWDQGEDDMRRQL